ncbi:Ig-like domain-containing protein, partial [Gammaproteobacteria bacterium]|nr:Ig-like domain-containing protein [Gammaproteobacteria bacterium]
MTEGAETLFITLDDFPDKTASVVVSDTSIFLQSPEIVISSINLSLKKNATAFIRFQLSAASEDFTLDDVSVTNGNLTNFQGEGRVYTAIFTPADGGENKSQIFVNSDTFSDSLGASNNSSNLLEIIANVNEKVTGSIAIIGALEEKQTLTADTSSLADEDGLGTFNYQWLRDGSAIAGATGSTYTTTASDIDKALSVTISYTDGYGTVETITSGSTSLIINDTSKAPTFSITSSADSYDEGQSALFSLVTTNLAAGTAVAYTLSGISESDLKSGSLSGKAVVSDSGTTIISLPLSADALTEGEETLTITLDDSSSTTASVIINDTSKNSDTVTTFHTTSILVDKDVLGASPVILEGLIEYIEKAGGVTVIHNFFFNGSGYD